MKHKLIVAITTIIMLVIINSSIASSISTIWRDQSQKENNFNEQNVQTEFFEDKTVIYLSEQDILNKKTIQLKPEILNQIDEFIKSINDKEKQQQVQKSISKMISPEGELDIETMTDITQDIYNTLIETISCQQEDMPLDDMTWPPEEQGASTEGGSTVFTQYDYTNEWTYTLGWPVYVSTGGNRISGSTAVRSGALAGGAAAETTQVVNFYIGRTKTITAHGYINSFGGKVVLPPGIASTSITCHFDWDQDLYFHNYINPPFDWNWFVGTALWTAHALCVYYGSDIDVAIQSMQLVQSYYELYNTIETIDELETHSITGSFVAQPGWHSVAIGLRTDASGSLLNTAHAGRLGQVTSIVIDGIAKPGTPTVNGPTSGASGVSYQFSAVSYDPNGEDVQYTFDWGDDSASETTGFTDSGVPVTRSHTYANNGNYVIRVYATNVDLLESSVRTMNINIAQPPELILSPGSQNFGNIRRGQYSDWYPFTLQNIGGGTATGTIYVSGTDSNQFEIESGDDGGFSLSSGQSRTIHVRFHPTSWGSKTAALKADGSNCDDVSSSLNGIGKLSTEACFLTGTKISMVDGSLKNIEHVKVGDLVKSFDVEKNKEVVGVVTNVLKHQPDEMTIYYVVINNELRITPNHFIFMNGKWIQAGDILVGDLIGHQNIGVNSIQKIYNQVSTYDLVVQQVNMNLHGMQLYQSMPYFAEGYLTFKQNMVCQSNNP